MLINKLPKANNGQALIELLIGFSILTIVMVGITFLIIGARESSTRSANILQAEDSLVLQNEALRSVRESGWDKLKNGTYHLISGPEYKISICYQTGCPPLLDETKGNTNGDGELLATFDFTQTLLLPGLRIKAEKITDCGSPPCNQDSLIKSVVLKDLESNRPMGVFVCDPAGCGIIDSATGNSDGNGELSVNFSYTGVYPEVTILVFKEIGTDGCTNIFDCLQYPSIGNMKVGGLDPGTSWDLSPGSETVDNFTRQINIEDTCRNEGETIVDCSVGTIDPSTKKITSSVTWEHLFGGSVENTFYLSRYLNNDTWNQSTQSEFDLGSYIGTESNPSGRITLQSNLAKVLSTFDNPGGANGFDTFVLNNFTYLTTGNGGGNPDLTIIDSSNPSALPTVPEGSVNLSTRVNGVFVEDDAVEGRFAYLATNSNSREIIVVDVSDKTSPVEVESLDLAGGQNAYDVFIQGSGREKFAYIGRQSGGELNRELYIVSVNTCFDVTGDGKIDLSGDILSIIQHNGDTGPTVYDINGDEIVNLVDINLAISRFDKTCPHNPNPNIVGSFEVGGGGGNSVNGVQVVGGFAYLATSNDDKELIVVDISDKTSPSEKGVFDIASSASNARDVFIEGNNAYLVTNNRGGPTSPEFFALDISNKSIPSSLGTYEVGGRVNSVTVENNIAYLSTRINGSEFVALDIQNPASITEFGTADLNGFANGIDVNNGLAYISTNNNTAELQIIHPGAGPGNPFVSSGAYESQTFDCTLPTSTATEICDGDKAGFNRAIWNVVDPDGAGSAYSINYQIEVKDTDNSWTFLGPTYNSSSSIPLDSVLGRYFRFKVNFSGDGNDTPILEDFSINYSP